MMHAVFWIFTVWSLTYAMTFAQGSLLFVGCGNEKHNDWSDSPYRWLVTHAPNGTNLVIRLSEDRWF